MALRYLNSKDKIKTEQALEDSSTMDAKAQMDDNTQDAIDALQVLGYNRKSIEKALEGLNTKDMSIEEIIKQGLKLL